MLLQQHLLCHVYRRCDEIHPISKPLIALTITTGHDFVQCAERLAVFAQGFLEVCSLEMQLAAMTAVVAVAVAVVVAAVEETKPHAQHSPTTSLVICS